MQPIRILHVVSSLNRGSGIMSVIMNYYRNIDREKVQFDFLYFLEMQETYKEEIYNLGGRLFQLPSPSLLSYKEYANFFAVNSKDYKAVHLHLVFLNGFILPLAKRNGIKNLITHSHNTLYSDKKLSAIRNRLLCLPIKKNANYYFACSKAAGEALYGKKYIELGKVKIINNAIDVERFKYNPEIRMKVRSEYHIEDKFVIGHVGRFAEQKNHTFLLDIFAEIKKRRPESVLMLIGDGPLFKKVKTKAELLGLKDSVLFLGTKKNVENYLQAMDTFVLPSLFEGLPVVGVEAQTSGLRCIFSEAITEEILLCNSKMLGLSNCAKIWADALIEFGVDYNREDSINIIRNKGFDIIEESYKLGLFYFNLRGGI